MHGKCKAILGLHIWHAIGATLGNFRLWREVRGVDCAMPIRV